MRAPDEPGDIPVPPVEVADTSFIDETIAVEIALFAGLAAIALLVGVISFALIRAGRLPERISLVLALSILGGMSLAVSHHRQRTGRVHRCGRHRGRRARCGRGGHVQG